MNKILFRVPDVKWHSGREALKGLLGELGEEIRRLVEGWFDEKLEAEVERWLGRRPWQRRDLRSGRQVPARCRRCGSTYQRDFTRHGHRRRGLLTTFGQLEIWVPRVVCRCGGSVSIPSKVLKPRQRIWDDVALQVHQWGKLALSLRQMQRELSDALHTSVGLRTLNERLQALKGRLPGQGELQAVPPVVVLDAIWVTLLVETGQYKRDKRGRLRSVKRKKRVAVLIALGVWPRSGRSTVLDWELAAGENRPDWEGLLSRLSQRRLWKERGLRLFIHDGGKGLCSALKTWYWEVPSQRCVFHKLRNVWQAIVVPDDYSPKQSRHLKRRIIHQAAAIFQAADEQAARKRLAAFRDRWRDTQPEAAQVLSRDLQDTLCFYTFLRTHPDWRPECLRTTSALERLNRKLRRPFRAACAYHSGEGLLAAASRVLSPLLA